MLVCCEKINKSDPLHYFRQSYFLDVLTDREERSMNVIINHGKSIVIIVQLSTLPL